MKPAALIATLALVLLAGPASAQERSIFDDVRLEAIPETNGVKPYPGEMVVLRVRGIYRPTIKIQHLLQPELTNFGWLHLGRGEMYQTEENGFTVNGFERLLAIFPQKTGPLTIGSFTHKLSLVDGVGTREMEVKSPPVTVDVAKWEGPGGPDDPNQWWLPAREVRVSDSWSADPNRVPRGETITRTVTIEAFGVTADQLPPAPVMRSAGIISFRGPTERDTKLTNDGPIAKATYRWNMRPITAFPATVDPVKFPWFDTISRTMREATIPAQRMAWAAEGAPPVPVDPAAEKPAALATFGVGAAAFLLGLAAMLIGVGGAALPTLPPRALLRLRLAALGSDAARFRAAITELARREPDRAARWSLDSEVRGGIAALDRSLYGEAVGARPNLRALARTILRARKATRPRRTATSALAPLDGV
ncbi:BatD family protein [Hansschlegelia quercus]|uniref:Protein BatD n=1 Tax=Hansschlegelia quercus TaxID=2528245 RepID=A0A4Q9GP34_9HYPH|nr:BatD family protein [Hansschlegelia quercus]TBN54544.1 hypothetical protein EYR15_06880 [Hansschlegelia quercus]